MIQNLEPYIFRAYGRLFETLISRCPLRPLRFDLSVSADTNFFTNHRGAEGTERREKEKEKMLNSTVLNLNSHISKLKNLPKLKMSLGKFNNYR